MAYYIWSELPTTAAGANKGAEIWTITDDGIITVSGLATAIGTIAATIPPDNNGAPTSTILANDAPRDVFISAVDSQGGQSVLQARFFMNCGPTS